MNMYENRKMHVRFVKYFSFMSDLFFLSEMIYVFCMWRRNSNKRSISRSLLFAVRNFSVIVLTYCVGSLLAFLADFLFIVVIVYCKITLGKIKIAFRYF